MKKRIELQIELAKAKARKYLRGRLGQVIQRANKALEDPKIDKTAFLGILSDMVYKGLAEARDVVYVDSNSEIKSEVRKAVLEYTHSADYGVHTYPPQPVTISHVCLPGPRDPKLLGSKASDQQVYKMAHRRWRPPTDLTPLVSDEVMASYKEAFRILDK